MKANKKNERWTIHPLLITTIHSFVFNIRLSDQKTREAGAVFKIQLRKGKVWNNSSLLYMHKNRRKKQE